MNVLQLQLIKQVYHLAKILTFFDELKRDINNTLANRQLQLNASHSVSHFSASRNALPISPSNLTSIFSPKLPNRLVTSTCIIFFSSGQTKLHNIMIAPYLRKTYCDDDTTTYNGFFLPLLLLVYFYFFIIHTIDKREKHY